MINYTIEDWSKSGLLDNTLEEDKLKVSNKLNEVGNTFIEHELNKAGNNKFSDVIQVMFALIPILNNKKININEINILDLYEELNEDYVDIDISHFDAGSHLMDTYLSKLTTEKQ